MVWLIGHSTRRLQRTANAVEIYQIDARTGVYIASSPDAIHAYSATVISSFLDRICHIYNQVKSQTHYQVMCCAQFIFSNFFRQFKKGKSWHVLWVQWIAPCVQISAKSYTRPVCDWKITMVPCRKGLQHSHSLPSHYFPANILVNIPVFVSMECAMYKIFAHYCIHDRRLEYEKPALSTKFQILKICSSIHSHGWGRMCMLFKIFHTILFINLFGVVNEVMF